jgi:hypothetical protein
MRFNSVYFVFFFSFVLSSIHVEAAELTEEQVNGAKIGMAYKEVRARLTELGYAPASPSKDTRRCGTRKKICKNYPEVEACSGTGFAPCRFIFRYPRGRKIVVITKGENLQVTDISEE